MMARRNTKISRNEQFFNLPQDIFQEILARLPVKSLLRLRCVSKSWLSLISSKSFMIKHLKNSATSTSAARRRFLFNYDPMNSVTRQYLRSFSDDESIDPSSYNNPKEDHQITGQIIGCCNGVFCIYKTSPHRLFLWNPAARISMELPEILLRTKYGFGWDEESVAYKMFVNVSDRSNPSQTLGKVYSSKTESWKTVDPGSSYDNCHGVGAFAYGKLHWLVSGKRRKYIETFDLKSDVFGRMKLPFFEEDCNSILWLRERGGRLCLVRDFGSYNKTMEHDDRSNRSHRSNQPRRWLHSCWVRGYRSTRREMWVMEQYGVEESWVKVADLWPGKIVSGNYDVYFYTQSLLLVEDV